MKLLSLTQMTVWHRLMLTNLQRQKFVKFCVLHHFYSCQQKQQNPEQSSSSCLLTQFTFQLSSDSSVSLPSRPPVQPIKHHAGAAQELSVWACVHVRTRQGFTGDQGSKKSLTCSSPANSLVRSVCRSPQLTLRDSPSGSRMGHYTLLRRKRLKYNKSISKYINQEYTFYFLMSFNKFVFWYIIWIHVF